MYFEHVPWLSYYVARVPALTRDLTHLRALAFKRTITRYQRGSSAKDLFYYLVRVLCRAGSILTHMDYGYVRATRTVRRKRARLRER